MINTLCVFRSNVSMPAPPVRFQGRPEVFAALTELDQLVPQSGDARLERLFVRLCYGSLSPEKIDRKLRKMTQLDIRRTALELSLREDKMGSRQAGEFRSACGLNGPRYSRWLSPLNGEISETEAAAIRGNRHVPPQTGLGRFLKKVELFTLKTRLLAFAYRQGLTFDLITLIQGRGIDPAKLFKLASDGKPATAQEEIDTRLWTLACVMDDAENAPNAKAWIGEFEAERGKPLNKPTKAFLDGIADLCLDTRYIYDIKGYATHSM